MLRYCIFFIFFSYVFCLDGISTLVNIVNASQKGSPCTRDGLHGQCVPAYQCLTAVIDVYRRDFPPICSFDYRDPIICCTDCELVNDTRLLLFDRILGKLTRTGTSKAKDKCLEYIYQLNYPCKRFYPKIIYSKKTDEDKGCTVFDQHYPPFPPSGGGASGGVDAKRGDFPHMALLGYGDSRDNADWLCGGTVISERFILTAAHCLYTNNYGNVTFIALGILKRSDPEELWQHYSVKRAIIHPEYQPPSKYHDIALLETDREISFNDQVRPACLHSDEKLDDFAVATGWGALGRNKGLSDVLQAVGLQMFSDESCAENFPRHRHLLNGYDQRTQMCFGDNKESEIPTDTCPGDSGGPLQTQNHEQCVFTIIGVTSYGRRCGESGGTGIYTRVASYVTWIESIVWP